MFHSVELCCYVLVSLYVYSKYLITYCCQLLKNCATFDIDAAHTLLWTMNHCGVVPTTLFNVWCYKKSMTSSNKLVTMSPNLIDSRSLFKVACFYFPSSLTPSLFIIYTDWSRGWIGCLATHHEFYSFIISIKTASTFNIRSADFPGGILPDPKAKGVGTNSGMDYWNGTLDWIIGLRYFPFWTSFCVILKNLNIFLEAGYKF